jgi:hypothetical protein
MSQPVHETEKAYHKEQLECLRHLAHRINVTTNAIDLQYPDKVATARLRQEYVTAIESIVTAYNHWKVKSFKITNLLVEASSEPKADENDFAQMLEEMSKKEQSPARPAIKTVAKPAAKPLSSRARTEETDLLREEKRKIRLQKLIDFKKDVLAQSDDRKCHRCQEEIGEQWFCIAKTQQRKTPDDYVAVCDTCIDYYKNMTRKHYKGATGRITLDLAEKYE